MVKHYRGQQGASEKPQPQEEVSGKQVDKLSELLVSIAPPADESFHLTGSEPFYAIKESDLPKLGAFVEAERAAERKLVEDAADRNAYERFRDELERLSHPQIVVYSRKDDLLYTRMIEDIRFGGDVIQVFITGDAVTDLELNKSGGDDDAL